jgi:hypothetical protein
VTKRICPRCHHVLQFEDEGSLVFCSNCGAPQVRLSEDLLAQAEQQQAGAIQGALQQTLTTHPGQHAAPPPDPAAISWKSMIRIAAVVVAFFTLPTMFLPPLALLIPAIVLALYASRFRQTPVTAGLGARIGLLCGLFLAVAISTTGSASLFLFRFTSQRMAEFDSNLAVEMAPRRAQYIAQQGQAAGQMFDHFAAIPEFRAGVLILGSACMIAALVVFCIGGGAFAGFVRGRTATR